MKKERSRMNFRLMIVLIVVMLVGFFLLKERLNQKIAALNLEKQQYEQQAFILENQIKSVQEELDHCEEDSYIENLARTRYQYISKSEKVYIITNPEMIYDDDEVPEY